MLGLRISPKRFQAPKRKPQAMRRYQFIIA
jgi:hypothetical protein